ncbi:glycerophosphodiester phosphodiesterase family protein [Dyadobacter sp. CY326]|uniref:glycerophosphodiester phosphodiesterase family protein n=1 Tax=Dyadobacter sp. CY326 TaxID=2907300 RepID=UPI001F2E79CA|nr:glycerophosphodiester phosphodiesterase family protein [Dyadobacter sp. CY326]MCE7067036.1 glycerophosphodiester phosphodiesterase family protein [Dyadobacter sp. CY326]
MLASINPALVRVQSLRYTLLLLISITISSAHAQVKIAAHRGGLYDQFPESAMSLFDFTADAFKNDTVFLEIDLRKSKDGTFYLMHDATVDRTTTGKGLVENLSDEYLNALYLKTKDGKTTTEHIPTFTEMLKFIRHRNVNLMLDIKAPVHREVLEQVKKSRLENRMLVLTFKDEITAEVASASQDVFMSALIETPQAWENFKQIPVQSGKRIAYITNRTPASFISTLRKERVLIMADVSEDLRNGGKPLQTEGYREKVKNQDLDILISDFPIEAREALGSAKKRVP